MECRVDCRRIYLLNLDTVLFRPELGFIIFKLKCTARLELYSFVHDRCENFLGTILCLGLAVIYMKEFVFKLTYRYFIHLVIKHCWINKCSKYNIYLYLLGCGRSL